VTELTLVGGVGRDVGVRWGVRPNNPWWYNSTKLYVTNYSQHTVTAVTIS